ncbi:MAG: hypothetical protein ACREA0_26370, partial [bacterium]
TMTLQPEGPAFEVPTFFDGPGGFRARAVSAAAYLLVGVGLTFGGRSLAAVVRGHWWRSRGVIRARRLEIVDALDRLRAELAVEDRPDGEEEVRLTLCDPDSEPRLRVETTGLVHIPASASPPS